MCTVNIYRNDLVFCVSVMKLMNCPEIFISIFEWIYGNRFVKIYINGGKGHKIKLQKGVLQGRACASIMNAYAVAPFQNALTGIKLILYGAGFMQMMLTLLSNPKPNC